ncbi:MAG: TAXI family TRAP transporter solute-binding subunit [Syntrophobacteraceae bacterium]
MKGKRRSMLFRAGLWKKAIMLTALGMALLGAADGFAAKELLFATGGVSGTFYPIGGAIAQAWNKNIPDLNVTVQATGGSLENVRLLGSKGAEVAICMNDIAFYGRQGTEAFKAKSEKYENYSAIGNVYPDVIQIFTRKGSQVKSISELKDKKVSVGPPGSGTEISARQVLGLYGIDYKTKKDINPQYLSYSEAADQFKDKLIEGAYFVVAVPNSALQDINLMHPVQFLEIDDKKFDEIVKAYPLYSRFTIPPNSYSGQTEPVKTIGVYSSILVRNDLPDDLVYKMTQTMYEQSAAIGQAHAAGKGMNVSMAIQGIAVPIHPGAQKYYKEKGVLK